MRVLCLLIVCGAALAAEPASDGVVYRGKPRTEEWLHRAHAAFRTKLAVVEGVVCDTGALERYSDKVRPGDACHIDGKVVRVLPEHRYLLRLATVGCDDRGKQSQGEGGDKAFAADNQVIRITFARALTRDTWASEMACIGVAEVDGKRYADCVLLPRDLAPLTLDQFRIAIAAGIELRKWTFERKRTRTRRGTTIKSRHVYRVIP